MQKRAKTMENEKIFKPEQLAEEVKKMPPEQAAMLWALCPRSDGGTAREQGRACLMPC